MKRTAVITGATGGIGQALAHALARRGYRLVLPFRDADRAQALRHAIAIHSPETVFDFIPCDLADFSAVAKCAKTILERHPVIDLFIANAATVETHLQFNRQGVEKTFAVNYLAHFILLSWIRRNFFVHSRVIWLGSTGARWARQDFLNDIHYSHHSYGVFRAYANSKLAVIAGAKIFSRVLGPRQIACNSVHPGMIATNIWPLATPWQMLVIPVLKKLYFASPAKGAEPVLDLALAEVHNETCGHFFVKKKAVSLLNVEDLEFQRALIKTSMLLCSDFLPTGDDLLPIASTVDD